MDLGYPEACLGKRRVGGSVTPSGGGEVGTHLYLSSEKKPRVEAIPPFFESLNILPYNTWDLRKVFGGDNSPGGDGHVYHKKIMQNYAKYKLPQRHKFGTTIVKKISRLHDGR